MDVYFRPSYSDPAAEITCRFWGGIGDPAGSALFRNMRIVRITGEPPPTAPHFDLAEQEEARLARSGHPRKVGIPPRRRIRFWRFRGAAAAVLILGTIVGISWRLLA